MISHIPVTLTLPLAIMTAFQAGKCDVLTDFCKAVINQHCVHEVILSNGQLHLIFSFHQSNQHDWAERITAFHT